MNKLKAGIYKEFLLLINDKVGLSMMVFLPILLVIIITSIQNSAFNLVNNNQIELIITNNDEDSLSKEFVSLVESSKLFKVSHEQYTEAQLNEKINSSNVPFGLFISKDFSQQVVDKSNTQLNELKKAMGLMEEDSITTMPKPQESIVLIYNPIIQSTYANTVQQMVFTLNKKLSTTYLLNNLSKELDIEEGMLSMDGQMESDEFSMKKSSMNGTDTAIPNASQHNVPAWSIFAVFFMVISLAGNFVKEKLNGSFDRVLTMPSSVWYLLISKALLFFFVSLFQISLIFTISRFLFEYIGLPTLYFPENYLGFIWAVALTGITAVNYSLLIGIYSKTVEQATGFGALSVIIFSAIGGIWVPSFIMPPLIKAIANISPLHWCIEMFYTIFLKNGPNSDLLFPSMILIIINISFILFAYLKLRKLNIIT